MSAPQINLAAAARQMRSEHGPDHPRHEMWQAMADLFDLIASGYAPYSADRVAAGFRPIIWAAVHAANEYTEAQR
jgi:hypothetical protein